MENNFTKKPSKFYNIHAHGVNLGPDRFFKLPPNVVFIMPSTRQSLYSFLITDGVMWQMNLLKPDETLLNIKDLIDAYKRNHKKIFDNPVDFKVYDSRTNENIYIPNILYDKDKNDAIFTGIVECPMEIKLEYLKDDDFVLPKSTEVLVNQQNIIHNNNPECKDKTRLAIPHNVGFVKKKQGEIESVTNVEVMTKLEEHIRDNLGEFKVLSNDFCGDYKIPGYNVYCGSSTYKENNNITNPIIPLLYPYTKCQSSKTYIIDGEDKYELIENPTKLSEIIKKYRDKDPDTVLYFFSFACNEIHDSLKTSTSKEVLEKAYIKRDTDGMLIDDYMKLQDNFNIKSIEEQENQEIRENIEDIKKVSNKDELIKYIQINKLNILRLEQIRDNLNDSLLKNDIIEIINFEKKNDIQYILDVLHTVNLTVYMDGDFPGMFEKIKDLIKDLIKDCTIDKINKIIDKIKNDEKFLIKDMVIQLLNEKKRNNIIEQLKEIDARLINTDISKRKSILTDVFKDIKEALNTCSKDDINIIKANIKDFEFKQVMTQAVESKEEEIEEKKKEIEEKEKDTDLTLLRFNMIDNTLVKYIPNNTDLYTQLNTKNIDENEINKIVNKSKLKAMINLSLNTIKDIVNDLRTHDELLNMMIKIKNSSLSFENLILNYIENKETQFILKLVADGKIRNKYLKYKKKYINLKKIIPINK